MRATRLLSILMTLQARSRVTAQALADECGVSLRTIYRDVDALSAAGVPVYSERGSAGGYRLLDGYRTRLNGLSPEEAEALFLTGLSGPAAELGLGAVVAGAELKLLAALPAEMRGSAERMRARFHLDAPGWFGGSDPPGRLPLVARAVWEEKRIRIRYRSWKGWKDRELDPLGMVLKGGAWYLIGQVEADVRTYRIARIGELTVLDRRFERPPGFDLPAYWTANTQRLEAELHPGRATVRLSPWAVAMLAAFTSPFAQAGTEFEDGADAEGWRTASVPIGSVRQAAAELLRFGAELEVLEPPELRARMVELTAGLNGMYGAQPA